MIPTAENTIDSELKTNIDTLASRAGVDISGLRYSEIRMGIDVEWEHGGKMGQDTDVIPGEDQASVLKIAVAHLRENPAYYTKLKKMEETLTRVQTRIENKEITTDDFNYLIESLPKSNDERVHRLTRQPPQYHDKSPGKQADDVTDREGNNDPTKTARGKMALRNRIHHNKQNPGKFREAVEFVQSNQDGPIEECTAVIENVEDKEALLALVTKLLGQAGLNINGDWLKGIASALRSRQVDV